MRLVVSGQWLVEQMQRHLPLTTNHLLPEVAWLHR